MIKPYRILIIEDEPDDIELIRIGFDKHDEFFLDIAITGEEGLEKISERLYDLVSLDFALPDISGLEVLERIREFDQDLPVVMVTGRDTEELQVVAFQKHATSYLAKSVDSFRSLPYIFEALIKEAKFRSAEKTMKDMVDRSEAVSRHLLDNSPVGIYILQEGCFKQVNPKFGDIFGCDIDDLEGKPFWKVVDPADFDCVHSVVPEDDQNLPYIHEFRINRIDGNSRWVEAQIVPVDYREERWVLGSLVDITRRKETELELRRRNRELTALYSIAMKSLDIRKDADEMLSEALSDVMNGIEGAEVGGIFLLDEGRLVLTTLHGSLEELIHYVDGATTEALLEGPNTSVFDGETSVPFWATIPIRCNGANTGLMVVGCQKEIEGNFDSFLNKLAWHIGRMIEIFQIHNISIKGELERDVAPSPEPLPDVDEPL